jgi:hypothetical protein
MIAARMSIVGFFALSGVLLTGCHQRPTTLNHVSGKVFFQGAPLHGGIIVFSPDTSRGESGNIAFSKIHDDGSYTLTTDAAAGATAGWYRITVASLSEGSSASLDSLPISLVPEKYRDPQLSLLQCEVKDNRDNHLDFNLD